MADTYRGHRILKVSNTWVYFDTGQPVADNPNRRCGHCGLPNTPEGHDGCLGTLPGVWGACCGHGQPGEAFILYPDRRIVEDYEALSLLQDLKASKSS